MEKPQVLEAMVAEARALMMQNKHLECEEKLREIDEEAEKGNLIDA